jgi:hypothetical protein
METILGALILACLCLVVGIFKFKKKSNDNKPTIPKTTTERVERIPRNLKYEYKSYVGGFTNIHVKPGDQFLWGVPWINVDGEIIYGTELGLGGGGHRSIIIASKRFEFCMEKIIGNMKMIVTEWGYLLPSEITEGIFNPLLKQLHSIRLRILE